MKSQQAHTSNDTNIQKSLSIKLLKIYTAQAEAYISKINYLENAMSRWNSQV
jgi:hypothetical protein